MADICSEDILKCINLGEWWKSLYYGSNFTKVWFSIGSDNGLAPNRWQAITWTNDDQVM